MRGVQQLGVPFRITRATRPVDDGVSRRAALASERVRACFSSAMDNTLSSVASFMTTTAGVLARYEGLGGRPVVNAPSLSRVSFADVLARYGSSFPRAVRMSEDSFYCLTSELRPRLPRRGLSAELQTAMALRYLGGGSYLDVCAAFGVHAATLYRSLWAVVDAVNATPSLNFSLCLDDPLRRRDYVHGFRTRRPSPFANVLGALDGVAVQQEQPSVADVGCVAEYYCRKGFYSFNTQAMCDANFEFTWMSCSSPGSAHDSAAFTSTALGQMLSDPEHSVTAQLVREGLCIVADDAYAAGEVLAVPWPGGGRGDIWRDAYNYHQSSCRIHIEQAFGMLVWRWGVFWRPLRVPFRKRPSLIRACFRLHNHCRRRDGSDFVSLGPFDCDMEGALVSFSENDNTHVGQRGRRRDRERSMLRLRMTQRVEELGLRRPAVATMY